MAFTHVLSPIRLAGVELRNRVVRAAHATNLGMGAITDDLIAYHVARGDGGVALSILEILGVHWSSPGTINVFVPGIDAGYRKMVDAVRPTGMKLFQQLWHAGHNSAPIDGSPPWSASDLPGMIVGLPAIPMTKTMIDEVVAAYADAARRCYEWGLDGVEIHASHGYLPAQFLSPAFNEREDDYGGSFENRIRFLLEVLTAVRASVPKEFAVGVRLAADELEGGLDADDNLRAAQYVEQRQLIDYLNLSLGNYQTFHRMIGGMHEPAGYEVPTNSAITHQMTVPTIVTGRFRTLEEADQVIRAGDASMVSFVRAMIADPDLIKKTIAGHSDQVRPCIACNQGCLARLLEPPHRVGCTVNAGAGFELSMGDARLAPSATQKRILVVGGGPAGMEAARVSALRGHTTVLAEASPVLGGALLLASKAPTRHGLFDFIVWLQAEIYRLGVEVRTSTYIESDDIDAGEWDEIIVATGSTPRMDGKQLSNPGKPISGINLPHVMSSADIIINADRKHGKNAVVIDDLGHYEGLAAAELLLEKGMRVTYVTRHAALAPKIETAQMVVPFLRRADPEQFSVLLRSRAISISGESVAVAPTYLSATTNQTTTIPADTVIFISPNRGNRALYDALRERKINASIIGDANSARQLPTAVYEGFVAGNRV